MEIILKRFTSLINMIFTWIIYAAVFYSSQGQQLNRIPKAQVAITNPGERGLIPAQPFWPSTAVPDPNRNLLLNNSAPQIVEHPEAHLDEVQSENIRVQDHGYRSSPAGTSKPLPPVILTALEELKSNPDARNVVVVVDDAKSPKSLTSSNTDDEESSYTSFDPIIRDLSTQRTFLQALNRLAILTGNKHNPTTKPLETNFSFQLGKPTPKPTVAQSNTHPFSPSTSVIGSGIQTSLHNHPGNTNGQFVNVVTTASPNFFRPNDLPNQNVHGNEKSFNPITIPNNAQSSISSSIKENNEKSSIPSNIKTINVDSSKPNLFPIDQSKKIPTSVFTTVPTTHPSVGQTTTLSPNNNLQLTQSHILSPGEILTSNQQIPVSPNIENQSDISLPHNNNTSFEHESGHITQEGFHSPDQHTALHQITTFSPDIITHADQNTPLPFSNLNTSSDHTIQHENILHDLTTISPPTFTTDQVLHDPSQLFPNVHQNPNLFLPGLDLKDISFHQVKSTAQIGRPPEGNQSPFSGSIPQSAHFQQTDHIQEGNPSHPLKHIENQSVFSSIHTSTKSNEQNSADENSSQPALDIQSLTSPDQQPHHPGGTPLTHASSTGTHQHNSNHFINSPPSIHHIEEQSRFHSNSRNRTKQVTHLTPKPVGPSPSPFTPRPLHTVQKLQNSKKENPTHPPTVNRVTTRIPPLITTTPSSIIRNQNPFAGVFTAQNHNAGKSIQSIGQDKPDYDPDYYEYYYYYYDYEDDYASHPSRVNIPSKKLVSTRAPQRQIIHTPSTTTTKRPPLEVIRPTTHEKITPPPSFIPIRPGRPRKNVTVLTTSIPTRTRRPTVRPKTTRLPARLNSNLGRITSSPRGTPKNLAHKATVQQIPSRLNPNLGQNHFTPTPIHHSTTQIPQNFNTPLGIVPQENIGTFPQTTPNTFHRIPSTFPITTPSTFTRTTPSTFHGTNPSTFPQTTPSTFPQTTPNTFPRTTPNTFPRTTPNTFPRTTPNTFPRTTPNTFPRTTPNTLTRTTPNTFTKTTPNTFSRIPPSTFPRTSPSSFPKTTPSTFTQTTPNTPLRTTSKTFPRTSPSSFPQTTPSTFPNTFSTFPNTFSTFPNTFSTFPTTFSTFPTTFSTFPTTFSTFPTTSLSTTSVPTPQTDNTGTSPTPPAFRITPPIEVKPPAFRDVVPPTTSSPAKNSQNSKTKLPSTNIRSRPPISFTSSPITGGSPIQGANRITGASRPLFGGQPTHTATAQHLQNIPVPFTNTRPIPFHPGAQIPQVNAPFSHPRFPGTNPQFQAVPPQFPPIQPQLQTFPHFMAGNQFSQFPQFPAHLAQTPLHFQNINPHFPQATARIHSPSTQLHSTQGFPFQNTFQSPIQQRIPGSPFRGNTNPLLNSQRLPSSIPGSPSRGRPNQLLHSQRLPSSFFPSPTPSTTQESLDTSPSTLSTSTLPTQESTISLQVAQPEINEDTPHVESEPDSKPPAIERHRTLLLSPLQILRLHSRKGHQQKENERSPVYFSQPEEVARLGRDAAYHEEDYQHETNDFLSQINHEQNNLKSSQMAKHNTTDLLIAAPATNNKSHVSESESPTGEFSNPDDERNYKRSIITGLEIDFLKTGKSESNSDVVISLKTLKGQEKSSPNIKDKSIAASARAPTTEQQSAENKNNSINGLLTKHINSSLEASKLNINENNTGLHIQKENNASPLESGAMNHTLINKNDDFNISTETMIAEHETARSNMTAFSILTKNDEILEANHEIDVHQRMVKDIQDNAPEILNERQLWTDIKDQEYISKNKNNTNMTQDSLNINLQTSGNTTILKDSKINPGEKQNSTLLDPPVDQQSNSTDPSDKTTASTENLRQILKSSRLPLLNFKSLRTLLDGKENQEDLGLDKNADNPLPLQEPTNFPPFTTESIELKEFEFPELKRWRSDLPYPEVRLPVPSPALSGLPFYIKNQRHLGPFFMVTLD